MRLRLHKKKSMKEYRDCNSYSLNLSFSKLEHIQPKPMCNQPKYIRYLAEALLSCQLPVQGTHKVVMVPCLYDFSGAFR